MQAAVDSARSPASAQGVAPLQAAEPGKVGVRGTQLGSVLDRQCSQVRVGCEIAAGAQRRDQLAENRQVARTRMHDGRGRPIQPGSHQIKSGIHGQRAPEQARPGGEPEECEKNSPRKADGFRSGQSRFQPGLRFPVQRGVPVDGVYQEVGVEKDRLRNESFRLSSSSSIASATASALSQRNSCPSPMRNVF